MNVSLIVPTYNKDIRFLLTLQTLINQNYPPDKYEVVIIAKDPSQALTKAVESASKMIYIKLILQKGIGRANARNEGIKQSSGEIIIFTDDDLLLKPDFISRHINFHQDKDVVVLGKIFQIYLSYLERVELKEIFEKLDLIAREDIYFKTVRKAFSFKNNNIPWIGFGTNNTSVRKEILSKVGVFDEDFKEWGQDNIELAYRLHKQGYRFFYNPMACNYHLAHAKEKETLLRDITRNIDVFYEKYPEMPIRLYRDFIFGKISLEYFNSSVAGDAGLGLDNGKIFYREYNKLLQWVKSNGAFVRK